MIDSLFIGNKDGGIISTITQAPQSDEPVVIIGLGGTGVDAISRLKQSFKDRLSLIMKMMLLKKVKNLSINISSF